MASFTPIAICGAGPVGQALALMLLQRGIAAADIVLLEAKTREQASRDARSIALSHGSQQLLKAIHAPVEKSTAIREIHVSRRAHFGRCLIQANEYRLPALGYVARYADILAPLEAAIARSGIQLLRPVLVNDCNEQTDGITLTFENGTQHRCQLLIQAEGGTFGSQVQGTQHHDYQQTAVVSHLLCDQPIAHRAFERFTEQGPLALLPQEDGYALVWCVRPETAVTLTSLDEAKFLNELQHAFGNRLGKFTQASPRFSFPLGLNAQVDGNNKRSVRIGNAAQTLHPVAGQGLNLGLRDAQVLTQAIVAVQFHHKDEAAQIQNALNRFSQLRAIDRKTSIRLTDTMARVFASSPDGSITQSLLGAGLGALDIVSPLKKILAEQMMFGWRQ
ncbi:FAD-dependent monooxygenase [Undibacterium flavidum]|uniref:FAD-dependent monooxygenase n=1 Tax=Undibacterium flavidum TaxID=2762297 RepID=A0ABR6Y9J2_9BURK|nr:FAD-dependent monooxygenase [Undibacterium flavidum]MBC3873297.1 FAD-dependent monooxygenase [Undibacterium flavidum]